MALINCEECRTEISDTALDCPKCGKRLKKLQRWSSPLLIGLFEFSICKYSKVLNIFAMQGTNDRRLLYRCL